MVLGAKGGRGEGEGKQGVQVHNCPSHAVQHFFESCAFQRESNTVPYNIVWSSRRGRNHETGCVQQSSVRILTRGSCCHRYIGLPSCGSWYASSKARGRRLCACTARLHTLDVAGIAKQGAVSQYKAAYR
eukprot:354917-Chlamydomonas_euryale.AAC.13